MKKASFAAALLLLGSTASAYASDVTVTQTNNPSNTKHIITFSDTPETGSFVDQFTFDVTDSWDSLTKAIVSSQMNTAPGQASNLNFSAVQITGNGHTYTLHQQGPENSHKPEVWMLNGAQLLSMGQYTMTLTGTTTGNAKYSGSMSLISSVPEPETYSLLLLGVGLIGFSVIRRKQENFS